MLLLALTAIITGTIGSPINAQAEEEITATGTSVLSVEASTPKLEYGILTAGNSYTKTLTITNNSAEQTTFGLSIASAAGVDPESQHSQMVEWITLGSSDYTLAGEASTNISVRVKVPKDTTAGGQYAALVASNASDDAIELANISAIISGDGLQYGGEVSSVTASWFNLSPEVKTHIDIKNTGNVDFDSTYKFAFRSIFGGDPIFEESATTTMYPGTSTSIALDYPSAPAIGIYKATQSVTYVNAAGEIVEHTTDRLIIMCPIWLLIILGVLIIGIIVLVIVLVKKRSGKGKSKKGSKKPSWENVEEQI